MEMLKNEYWIIYRCAYRHGDVSEQEKKIIQKLYDRDGREIIYSAVKQKKLIPAVAMLFKKLDIDSDFWSQFVDAYRSRNMQVVKCLDEMYQLFAENGVNKIVVVENFGALLASTQDIAMFGSGDIDEYACPCEKEKIYRILKNAGYEIEEVHAGGILVSSSIRRANFPDGFYFGINWDVTNRVNLPSFTANGDFIGWSHTNRYKDTAIRLPSKEGLMYTCLMHIAVHGFCKAPDIRLYYDIANAAESKPNWDTIIEWAKRDKNTVKVAIAAYLAKKLLEVDIPDYVLNIGNKKQKKRLLNTVYNKEENRLLDRPKGLRRILIDVYIEDDGAFCGLLRIVFPNNDWIKKKYGNAFIGHIKHIWSLIH